MVGDVVWAPFPFTSLQRGKVRPVLVIADARSAGQDDWIVCEITSSSTPQNRAIPIDRSDMQSGRLQRDSVARPDRLFTMNEGVFRRVIGRVTDAKQAEVRAAVRSLFTP